MKARIVNAGSTRGVDWLYLPALCLLALLPRLSFGLNPNQRISQYAHTAWRLQDGSLTSVPNAIAQTTDGYLWVGTANGLFRFDGVRFAPFVPPAGKSFPSQNIIAMLAAKDGGLWFSSGHLLQHFKDGDLIQYSVGKGEAEDIIQLSDGTVWIGLMRQSSGEPICRVEGLNLRCYGTAESLKLIRAARLVQDSEGALWFSSEVALESWHAADHHVYSVPALQSRKGLSGIDALAVAPDGSIWVGMSKKGVGAGLQHLVNGQFAPVVLPGFNSGDLDVTNLLRDREGALWIGTASQGVYRMHGNQVDHFRATDGLSSDFVNCFYEDREGDIWVGTAAGLDKFRDLAVITYSTAQGLRSGEVNSVLASKDGTVWVGDGSYLESIRNGKVKSIDKSSGLPGTVVMAMLEDHLGRFWVGVDDNLFVRSGDRFHAVKQADGTPVGDTVYLSEGVDGTIWDRVLTGANIFRWMPSETPQAFKFPGLPKVTVARADPSGGAWLGLANGDLALYRDNQVKIVSFHRAPRTGLISDLILGPEHAVLGATDIGLAGWRDGKSQTLGPKNGLPCANIFTLVVDQRQTLWLYMECGVVSIANSEMQRWWQNPDAKLNVSVLDALDGAQTAAASFGPGSAEGLDGKLWFANGAVLQQIDPLHMPFNRMVPPVHIEGMIADRIGYTLREGLRFPAPTRDLEIDYTALSFPIPQRVRFRYRLDGWDTDWQDVATRRQAFYTNLRPGPYTFHVIACNNDGLWNETGATIAFSIAPAYYQTLWFQLLCVGAVTGMIWIAYLARLRYATAQIRQSLGTRMEERERIARELHDTLLQGVQGLMLRFQGLMKKLPEHEPVRQMMGQVLDRADEVLLEGRERVRDLRAEATPMDDLVERLKRCAEELAQDYPIAFNLVVAGVPQALEPTISNEVYQIAREALTNAFQHSNGARVEAKIAYDNAGLRVVIRDDGRGIEEKILDHGRPGHWGVAGMRERGQKIGAKLHIHSHADKGTEIDLAIPAQLAYRRTPQRSVWTKIRKAIGN